ncbi:MAG TPA: response regulator [Bryobacteraceae bacterium]|jgi:PAS domain S-box-containing protein
MRISLETDDASATANPKPNKLITSRLRVLIIDDDPVDREIFKQYLDADRPGAFLYAESQTGRDGLRQRKSFSPDCILLDFNLPDLDGLKMVRLLREEGNGLPCAVVMLTGTGNEEIAVEAMKLGVMDYLAKGPSSAFALSRTVANAVQRFRFQEEIARQRVALEQRNLELEATRAELFDEKERYRILAETIPQLVWTADCGGRIHYANQRLAEFSGNMSAGLGSLESLVHADDKEAFRGKWKNAVQSGCGFETELRIQRTHDQTWRWHLMRTAPIPAAEKGPLSWFGTFTDIEDQKRAEAALRRREKLDSIGLLAGGIAHEFNNLLAGIMAGASFALESMDPAHSAFPILEIILGSSERAANLTRQLLEYSGKIQVLLETTDIRRIVDATCAQARTSIPENIDLSVESAEDLPSIETNANYVQQVILSLMMNAVEAIGGKPGCIKVTTTVSSLSGPYQSNAEQSSASGYELPAGEYVCVQVSDSGPGMDDRMQAQIFDPFFTTKFTGRGLGLAAVQGIVRSLGGGILLSSVAGLGSKFRIMLPLREAAGGTSVPNKSAGESR